MKNFIKNIKKHIFLLITLGVSLSLLFFIKENILKGLVLEFCIWFWYFLGKKTKNYTYSSFLLLFLILPFNISIQFLKENVNPYVNGVFTNYLVPTLSILDVFAGIFLISSILERKFTKKHLSWDVLLLILFPLIQLALGIDVVAIVGVWRMVLYLLSFRVLIDNIELKGDKKFLILTKILIVVQVGISLLQFLGGSSLGLAFLGESIFSAGMKGSNFVDLAGNLYIRGYGTFPHPNILAGWFLLTLIILWKERKGFLFLILSSIGILLTFSRLGIFLLTIFWIFVLIKYLKESKRFNMFSIVGILPERVLNLFNGGDRAVMDRVNLLKESFVVFKNNWLMGSGYNTFVREMGESMPKTANGVWLNQPVHNVLMLSLCELGVLGTVLVGISYWKTFSKKRINLRSLENIFIIICLISIGMVDHYLFSLPQGIAISMFLLYFLGQGLKSKKPIRKV